MTEFVEQDLDGARFERVSMRNARMHRVNLSGAEIRGSALYGVRMIGVEMWDVEISAELNNVVVNGVDIGPLVEQELNRRMRMTSAMSSGLADEKNSLIE